MSFTKSPRDGDRMMDKKINTLVGIFLVTVGLTTREVRAEPVVYIGGSGTGISSTLMKVIWETNTWKKHGLDVRNVFFTWCTRRSCERTHDRSQSIPSKLMDC